MTVKDTVVDWIAPQGIKNVLAWLVGLVGMAAVVGVPAVGGPLDSSVQTGGLVAGGVLLFVGVVLDTQLRHRSAVMSERKRAIYYRASWVSLIAVLVTATTLTFGLSEDVISLSAMETLSIVFVTTFGVFFVAQWGYRWVV